MQKRHFCLFVTLANVLTKRKGVNITVLLCQCIWYRQIFTVSPVLSAYPVWGTTLLPQVVVTVRIIWDFDRG